jgi:Fe2+ transport system protein FeoA
MGLNIMYKSGTMSLWNLNLNQSARVKGFDPSLPDTFRDRLEHLGFAAGEDVACVRRTPFNGPRVYRVGDSIFSLAQDIASAVLIEDHIQ